jgi:hypothetical protein
VLGGGVLLGIAAARFLKASSRQQPRLRRPLRRSTRCRSRRCRPSPSGPPRRRRGLPGEPRGTHRRAGPGRHERISRGRRFHR